MTTVVLAEVLAANEAPIDNAAVVALGFDWITARLDSDDGESEWRAYLAARRNLIEAETPAGIDRLGTAFGLSAFEEDVLLIALAGETDGALAARYAAALGGEGAAQASLHLLARILLGEDRLPANAWVALGAEGTLRRFALIEIEGEGPAITGRLRLPERVRGVLLGADMAVPSFAELAQPQGAGILPARLEAEANAIAGWDAAPLRVQLTGSARSGRRELAARTFASLGFGALRVEAEALEAGDLAILARECVLGNAGLILADPSLPVAMALERILPVPLALIAGQPLAGMEAVPIVRLPVLLPDERLAVWQAVAPGAADASRMAEHFALGPGEIAAIAQQPAGSAWAAAREIGVRELEALANRITPERSFADLVLAPDCMADLHALAAQVDRRAEVYRDWGYRRVVGRATGVSALFAGPSGVGKTMAAEAIARALDLELFTVDLSRVTSKYIGETEKNLARIFDAAEAGGCVLLFDEADALFGKRSEVKDSHDRYANAEVSYLLQRMEHFGGLVILATNLKANLDTAFLRRIRVVVDFAMPDVAARKALWQRALPIAAPQEAIDIAALARHDLSGGNITTIAANAAFRASQEGSPIGMAHLRAAMAAEFRKLERDPSTLGSGR